jgi:hypothetical protein
MNDQEKIWLREGLQELAERAKQKLVSSGVDRLPRDQGELRQRVLGQMTRIAEEDFKK